MKETPCLVLGTPLHSVTTEETLDVIDQMVQTRDPGYIVTANVDFARRVHLDVELQDILFQARLVVCDGTPLRWSSQLLGANVPERVTGADLLPAIAERAETRGHRLFFLGADDSTMQGAREALEARHPELNICGTMSPPKAGLFDLTSDEMISRIRQAEPDILLVAFGCPKQEKWISMNYRRLGIPCSIGIGAAFDFQAGNFSRAPVWAQKAGMEWAFRLAQEPTRLFQRYESDFRYLTTQTASEWLSFHSLKSSKVDYSKSNLSSQFHHIELSQRFSRDRITDEQVNQLIDGAAYRHSVIDLSPVDFIDSFGLGVLVRIYKTLKKQGCSCAIVQGPHAKLLEMTHIDRLMPAFPSIENAEAWIEQQETTRTISFHYNETKQSLRLLVQKDITADNVRSLRHEFDELFQDSPKLKFLEIDLQPIRFIDSSGLGFLIQLSKIAQQGDLEFAIVNAHENILNVIRLANLDALFGFDRK